MNRPARPPGYEHLPAPDKEDALTMAGVLFHYIAGSEELRGRLARWMEHHDGDLDECHALLEPGHKEPLDMDFHPGRTR